MTRLATALLVTLLLAPTACTRSESVARPVVAVSVPPQAWMVEQLAGELVSVRVMIPPGAEAHSYEPSLKDVTALANAALYVAVGHPKFPFEQARLRELLRDHPDIRLVNAMDGVATDADDPHVWVAPSLVRKMVRNIARALSELLPEERGAIENALSRVENDIDALDRELRELFGGRKGWRFFVFHPAWSYFARDYGLVQVAIEREGREPDPSSLAKVMALARAANVKVIFVQPQQSSAGARLVAEEIGARIETIDPMAYDWLPNLRTTAAKIAEGLVP